MKKVIKHIPLLLFLFVGSLWADARTNRVPSKSDLDYMAVSFISHQARGVRILLNDLESRTVADPSLGRILNAISNAAKGIQEKIDELVDSSLIENKASTIKVLSDANAAVLDFTQEAASLSQTDYTNRLTLAQKEVSSLIDTLEKLSQKQAI